MAKAAKDKAAEDNDEGAEETTTATAQTHGRPRRVLALILGGAMLLIIGAGAGAYAFGLLDIVLGSDDAAEAHDSDKVAAPPVFYALPDLLVSLNTGERRSTFLKVKVSLQLADAEDQPHIERLLPRIIDYCQVYLRELRLDELRGSAGTARLREELLRRISAAVAPVQVTDVLFGEIFIQ
jgi:flagellar protein FliL